MKALISVIIPTYNRKEMLTQAIDSVLTQTYKPLEILVIDDCSTDGTEAWVKERYQGQAGLTYMKNDANRQAGYSRNRGYRAAKGDFLVFLDDDDYYTDPAFFEKAMAMHARDDYAFVSANADQRFEEDASVKHHPLNKRGRVDRHVFLNGFQQEVTKPHSTFTTVFKRANLQAIDFEGMKMMNDGPIYMRALLSGDPYFMEDFIGVYRMHKTNISFDLDLGFLLQNLDEKLWVAKRAENLDKDWMARQVRVTIDYYVKNSRPDKGKQRQLLAWVKEKVPEEEGAMKRLIFKLSAKNAIKKIIKP